MVVRDVYVCGDLHRNMAYVLEWLEKYDIRDSLIIVTGDFNYGIGAVNNELRILKEYSDILAKSDNFVFSIRGNHDNPLFFQPYFAKENMAGITNVKFLPDYTSMRINDMNYLFVGGAVSIDRVSKAEINAHFPDEVFKFNKEKIDNLDMDIDVVITHTAPNITFPYFLSNVDFSNDASLKDDLIAERQLMTDMFRYLKQKHKVGLWIYGHFHKSKTTFSENTNFVLLDVIEIRNILSL